MSERNINEFPDFGLTPAQRREAVLGHYYEYPGMDGPRGEIWCYTDAYSYLPGATVNLQVSATASRFDIEIVRDGAVETPVFSKRGIDCKWQETPAQCSVVGCGWETTFAFKTDENWPSGAYRITLKAHGNDGQPIHCHHLFILRPAAGASPDVSCRSPRPAHGPPIIPGVVPTIIRALPGRMAINMRRR